MASGSPVSGCESSCSICPAGSPCPRTHSLRSRQHRLFLGIRDAARNRRRYRHGRPRRQAPPGCGLLDPARAVQQVVQQPVRGLGEQALPLLQELRVVPRLPEFSVHRDPLRGERAPGARLDLGEVLGRRPVADLEVRVLGQETEVRDRVHLRAVVIPRGRAAPSERCDALRARSYFPSSPRLRGTPRSPVPRLPNARQRVQHGVEARSKTVASEVPGLHSQAAVPEAEPARSAARCRRRPPRSPRSPGRACSPSNRRTGPTWRSGSTSRGGGRARWHRSLPGHRAGRCTGP